MHLGSAVLQERTRDQYLRRGSGVLSLLHLKCNPLVLMLNLIVLRVMSPSIDLNKLLRHRGARMSSEVYILFLSSLSVKIVQPCLPFSSYIFFYSCEVLVTHNASVSWGWKQWTGNVGWRRKREGHDNRLYCSASGKFRFLVGLSNLPSRHITPCGVSLNSANCSTQPFTFRSSLSSSEHKSLLQAATSASLLSHLSPKQELTLGNQIYRIRKGA